MFDAVLQYTSRIRSDEHLKRMAALAATSSALGANAYMSQGQLFRLYPNLFMIVVAHPGNGKSLISNIVNAIVDKYNLSQEGFPENQISVAPKKFNPASFIEFLLKTSIRDVGGEEACPILIPSSELSVMVSNTKHGNVLEDFLDMYDCPPVFTKYTRTNGYERIPRIVPTIIGATTPSFWKSFMPANLANDGFTSRTLLYFFDELIKRDGEIQWGSDDELNACVREMGRLRGLRGVFEWSQAGREWYLDEFTPQNNSFIERHFRGSDLWMGYANRRSDQMKKISMLLSANDGNDLRITPAHGKKAVKLLASIEANMNGLLLKREMKPSAATRDDILYALRHGPMTVGELLAHFSALHAFMHVKDLEPMLNSMSVEGVLIRDGDVYSLRKRS